MVTDTTRGTEVRGSLTGSRLAVISSAAGWGILPMSEWSEKVMPVEVVVVPNPGQGAALVAEVVGSLVTRSPAAVLGLATGSSPEPLYRALATRVTAGRLQLGGVEVFLLDEYVGLPPGHPASYREVIRHQVTEPLALDPARVHGLDGRAGDLVAECRRYETAIATAGGVDLQLLGIGVDGHIGFNEPGSSLGSRTRLKTLTEQTAADNRRFFGGDGSDVPRHVVTQGIGTILEARHLVLMAWGSSKAHAVAQAVEGPLTAMVPASVLQLHPMPHWLPTRRPPQASRCSTTTAGSSPESLAGRGSDWCGTKILPANATTGRPRAAWRWPRRRPLRRQPGWPEQWQRQHRPGT